MSNNPTLKSPPSLAKRPQPLSYIRWLLIFVAISFVLLSVIALMGEGLSSKMILLIGFSAAGAIGSVLFLSVLFFNLMANIIANGKDRQREQWIYSETQKSRRALQIISAELLTGHDSNSSRHASAENLIKNQSIITSQPDRQGQIAVYHSQLASDPNKSPGVITQDTLDQLLTPVIAQLEKLPSSHSLKITLNLAVSLNVDEVKNYIAQKLNNSNAKINYEFISGDGIGFIDSWMDTEYTSECLLLIIALQIAPVPAKNTAEAGIALLLGNRLTQKSLPVMALLHRPDKVESHELKASLHQAGENVPVKEQDAQYLWLAGLTEKQYQTTCDLTGCYPVMSIKTENIINVDSSLGDAGVAAAWLAIAATAHATTLTQGPHFIITGDKTKEEMWSLVIAPEHSQQEKDT